MAKYMSMENLRFTMYGVHNIEKLYQFERFQDYDKESTDILMDSVKDYADKMLYPIFREMDEDPARYEDGKIYTHPKLGEVIRAGADLGLLRAMFDYEDEGMQMPGTLYTLVNFIAEAANNHAPAYINLTMGAAELIGHFGNDELKKTYLPKMLDGSWGGTMCLTEPQAGSSLSDITTSASPQEDGSYQIKGQKIFISAGDHEHCENFVHLVLARIDGAPAGTKGISLFVVPKKRIVEGGLESNDVLTVGDFQKMGQRGACATHLVFGEEDNCQGWLVGKQNQGLKAMFLMMNGARIGVGRGGIAIATAAYYASLQYANERPQGRKLTKAGIKDVNKGQTLIINHPDVRRMLLLQKAVSEGALSLLTEAAIFGDIARVGEGEEKENSQLLLEILTPVVKTYPSEMGRVAVNNGLQILGGYGFCSEFVLQQYLRDIRIFSLYEGTTGIQSLDLLGRKVTLKGGKAMHLLASKVMEDIQASMTFDDLKPYAKILGNKLGEMQKVLSVLMGYARKGEYERFLADATLFMDFFSTIVIGWQWLKMATVAKNALLMGKTEQTEEFYEAKIHTMKFYFKYELPKTVGLAQTLVDEAFLTLVAEKELIA